MSVCGGNSRDEYGLASLQSCVRRDRSEKRTSEKEQLQQLLKANCELPTRNEKRPRRNGKALSLQISNVACLACVIVNGQRNRDG